MYYSSPVKKNENADSHINHLYDPTTYYFSKFGSSFDQFCSTKFKEKSDKPVFQYFSTAQLQVNDFLDYFFVNDSFSISVVITRIIKNTVDFLVC